MRPIPIQQNLFIRFPVMALCAIPAVIADTILVFPSESYGVRPAFRTNPMLLEPFVTTFLADTYRVFPHGFN